MTSQLIKPAGACLLGLALMAAAALAQRPEPGQMVERQLAAMKERLKLTDEQVAKVKPILEESSKKMMAMREKMEPGQPPSDEAREEMRKNREETNKKLAEVLSKEQMADYEKMMSEQRGRFGKGGPPKQ